MSPVTESIVEDAAQAWLRDLGYGVTYGPTSPRASHLPKRTIARTVTSSKKIGCGQLLSVRVSDGEPDDQPNMNVTIGRLPNWQLAAHPSYNQPMSTADLYPRLAAVPLRVALADSPVVLIHGPRQCGKTTLARMVCDPLGYRYITFDDDVAHAAAQADPAGFVDELPEHAVLDEVQRVPALFTALKRAVDRHRTPGRFVLTGSTNVLLVPAVADSLAGRMEIVRLHPLAQVEIARTKPAFLGALFDGGFRTRQRPRLGRALAERIAAGGYPAARPLVP